MYAGEVTHTRTQAIQRIDLPHQVALADAPEGRVARHLPCNVKKDARLQTHTERHRDLLSRKTAAIESVPHVTYINIDARLQRHILKDTEIYWETAGIELLPHLTYMSKVTEIHIKSKRFIK